MICFKRVKIAFMIKVFRQKIKKYLIKLFLMTIESLTDRKSIKMHKFQNISRMNSIPQGQYY